jgi:hypothetical protein
MILSRAVGDASGLNARRSGLGLTVPAGNFRLKPDLHSDLQVVQRYAPAIWKAKRLPGPSLRCLRTGE